MKIISLALASLILISFAAALPLSLYAAESPVHLMVVEWSVEQSSGRVILNAVPPDDDSMTNPDYKLLGFKWTTTANYWINPSNTYGFSDEAVVTAITTSAETWEAMR